MATITTFTSGEPFQVEPGDVFDVDLDQFSGSTSAYKWATRSGSLPAGVDHPFRTRYVRGTVTEAAAGTSSTARFARVNTSGSEVSPTPTMVWEVPAGAPPEPTVIPVPVPEQTATGYRLPSAEGVRWIVDGTERAAGPYSVDPGLTGTTVTIIPEALDGYTFDTEATPVVLTFDPEVPPVDATTPTTTLPLGTEVVLSLSSLYGSSDAAFSVSGTLPPGLSANPMATRAEALTGTPTEAGAWTLSLQGRTEDGDFTETTLDLTITVEDPDAPEVIPVPAAQGTEDGYILPEVEGVRWIVDGTEQPAGSYSVQPVTEDTTVTIIPEALEGYTFDAEPEPLVLKFAPAPDPDPEPDPDPDPDPEPEPEPEDWLHLLDEDPERALVAGKLAPRALRHAGTDPDSAPAPRLAMAEGHVATVLEYVKGYTRGRGFHGYVPERPLQAVIVAASARLVTNPEQLTYYSTGDYSERPATLTGWTLAELATLRRYRRVTA